MSTILTLTDFLLARIAEDEADPPSCSWRDYGAFSPARIEAECEAKRRIVEMYAADDWSHPVMQHLGSVYADHSDYREEWRA